MTSRLFAARIARPTFTGFARCVRGLCRTMRCTVAIASAFVSAFVSAIGAGSVQAQSFGRSKVQYDNFDFRILTTPHFKVLFYPAESLATADAARMAERWYVRHASLFNQAFEGNPLIFYADPPDFQQSNVVEGELGVGTGGVTEGNRDRVIMPFTGIYADNDHVLGHELVHVFQYRIAAATPGGARNIGQIPLWLIEGMAEYLSLGRDDPNTAMWLRDAARRNDLPTIKQLTTDARFFPYRYGQALWAYIGGRWGDDMINQLYRAALRRGWEPALKSELGMSADSLSSVWHSAIRQQYAGVLTRTPPDSIGRVIIPVRETGDQNVSPSVSPDGRYVAFFSSRNLFGIDLFVAETSTGRIIRQLTNITRNPHFDALSFINSAGSWSPDGKRIAIVTFAQGDNQIEVLDVTSGDVDKRISITGVGALADPAWSPDGKTIAFSGLAGGISDLYLYDYASGAVTRLTNDREAQIQPAWSPDGRMLAFVTDAGPETRFTDLSYGELRLAVINVDGTGLRLLPRLARGKAINPQFTSAGDALYFVSDQDGVSDIYRTSLTNGATSRITTSATGISGITGSSPAMNIARATGDIVFSVFDKGGFGIRSLSPAQTVAMSDSTPGNGAGILPPPVGASASGVGSIVARNLLSPDRGLPARAPTDATPYRAGLTLESVGGASVGASIGGGYGAGVAGGVAFGFADLLNDNLLNASLQVNGTVKDFGGQLQYLNRSHRLNYGAVVQHIPLAGVGAGVGADTFNVNGQLVQGLIYTRIFQRQYFDDVQGIVQYPFSATRRLEFSAGGQRVAVGIEVESTYVVGTQVLRQEKRNVPSGFPALTFGTASVAYVGDYSFFGFTSPVAGGRYRFEVAPYVGSINYETVLADYRRYVFRQPFTLAMRGLHFGRYGPGADDNRLQPFYIGQNALIRGYDPADFRIEECTAVNGSTDSCPQFSRLNGSRIGVVSMELRVPLFGTERLGLINLPFLPTEIAPFVDAGVAWRQGDNPSFRFDRNTSDRVPVFSAGVAARVNLFGYAVVQAFYAHPFQRPVRGNVFGFQFAPGW